MLPLDRREAILALAMPIPDIDIDPGSVVLTAHAVQRYRQRVEGVQRRIAVRRLGHLLSTADWEHRPRAWTEVMLHPEVVYGYSPDRSDVCLLVRGTALVTVLSRRFLAQAIPHPRARRCG
ncbi:hypothetical protein [Pseudonocardia acidicola]|uniref:Uncharacterized protein n=1 Tax=Pseudonocardia acidicola TaxID=2724939 RepID=A0ABX1SCL5_9PSEU|nr:hypothetical protein [Pseudonocardia acidicola]NMH97984.1 hypothetical protein [Pseudonocardia acidicola]